MSILLPLLILAITPGTPGDLRYSEAKQVFRCTFDTSCDANFDNWPDGWTRRRGPGFPHYVEIKISEESSPVDNRCLRITLNGGGAVAYSPALEVSPLYSYVLEGQIKTEGLKHDSAFLSITLLGENRNRLEAYYSKKVRTKGQWRELRVGPVSPRHEHVRLAIIALHLEGGTRQDLTGAALFDDIRLGRLPRMSLSTNNRLNLFDDPTKVEINCKASGFTCKDPTVIFHLEDVRGDLVARAERRLTTRAAAGSGEMSLESLAVEPSGQVGTTKWNPPIPGPGFYRVRAWMKDAKASNRRWEFTMAVIEPRRNPPGGRFGWSLPRGDKPLPLDALAQLACQSGINWLKYPIWFGQQANEAEVEKLILFGERLASHEIELVGMLNRPPDEIRDRFGSSDSLPAVDIFTTNPDVWCPSLEPVLTRMATWVRWWQLGPDKDTSFTGCLDLNTKIARVREAMDRVVQGAKLGVGWGWLDEPPRAEGRKPPLEFLALSADPPLTNRELTAYLSALEPSTTEQPRPLRWVVLEPLPRDLYSTGTRATDLLGRMMAAKIRGADAIFASDPFNTKCGLLNDDGTPGELLLPWRTTALLLGGTKYIGSIQLPGGSSNRIFSRDDGAVMVVWNDSSVQEVIYLGEEIRQIDLWGRGATPDKEGHRQVLKVGPVPTFVVGLNEQIARWRMDFSFSRSRIPSIFGRRHTNSFDITNHFTRGTVVRAALVTPKTWNVDPEQITFRLAGGEKKTQPIGILLPYNASSGRQKVRADFEVEAERPYRFSVYRHIDVGMGDVYINIATQLNDRGEIEVRQQFVNNTSTRVSFQCELDAPGRRRQKTQIVGMPRGNDVRTYRLPDGKKTLGKTLWLRAEEMDGPRILNYRFTASR